MDANRIAQIEQEINEDDLEPHAAEATIRELIAGIRERDSWLTKLAQSICDDEDLPDRERIEKAVNERELALDNVQGNQSMIADQRRHIEKLKQKLETQRPTSFAKAWEQFQRAGFQYGTDALEQVRFGFEIAQGKKPHQLGIDPEVIYVEVEELDRLRKIEHTVRELMCVGISSVEERERIIVEVLALVGDA